MRPFHPWQVGNAGGGVWGKSKIQKTFPQGLKPILYYQTFAARLKSCPYYKTCLN